ncbi:hypothetical protein QFZ51_002411 [Chitinophaga sp. W3I9]
MIIDDIPQNPVIDPIIVMNNNVPCCFYFLHLTDIQIGLYF